MTNKWWNDDESLERMERSDSSSKPANQQQVQQKIAQQIAQSQEDAVRSRLEAQINGVGGTEAKKAANFTPLDTEKLQKQFEKQDNPELDAIREKLHYLKLQQGETEKAIEERKQEELTRKELQEQEEEMKKMNKQEGVPFAGIKGKKRKSIFGGNKEKADVTMENKPADGKQ